MEERATPYVCHVLVCVNRRESGLRSCGGSGNDVVRSALKDAVAEHGLKGRVRVSGTLCLGLCEQGPNVLLYPQGIWFSGVAADDAPRILARVEALLAEAS